MQTASKPRTGSTLMLSAVTRLLAEGHGWAYIGQLALNMALEQSKAPHTPQKPRFKK